MVKKIYPRNFMTSFAYQKIAEAKREKPSKAQIALAKQLKRLDKPEKKLKQEYSYDNTGRTLTLGKKEKPYTDEQLARITQEKEISSETQYRIKNPIASRLERFGKAVKGQYQEKIKGPVRYKTNKKGELVEYRAGLTAKKLKKSFEGGAGTTASRYKAAQGGLAALGIIQTNTKGAGRPKGSYIHGMPIHIYKEKLRQDKALYQQYQDEQQGKLRTQGFTPEQVQQLQQQQTISELQTPSQPQAIQQLQQRQARIQMLQQAQQGQMPTQDQFQRFKPQQRYAQDMPFNNPSDDELKFMKWKAEQTIHPNTQRLMQEVRRIQLLGQTANIEQARRNRERRMLANQMDLMKAHTNMTKVSMDFTGVPEDNILFAPSVFKEDINNNILRPRGVSILDTQNGGNNLNFF